MIRSRHGLWLSLLLLQGGCAILTTNNFAKLEPKIDKWVEAKEYGQALEALDRVDPKDPQYPQAAEKRRQVEALATNYEQDIRRQTRLALDKGKWDEALNIYDEALQHLPHSVVLKDGLSKLHREQAERLEALELERLLAHGNRLKQTLPTYETITRVDPRSDSAREQLAKIQQQAEEVASELALFGSKALANNRLDTADKSLSLAAELSDAPAIRESLRKLRQRQSNIQAEQQAKQRQERQNQEAASRAKAKKIDRLLKAYRKAYSRKNYIEARKKLGEIQHTDRGNAKWDRLGRELNDATEKEAERLFQRGVSAYSRGHFERAATLWREALELKPDHKTAQESLDRAERVLEKLKQLKKKQAD